MSTHSPSIAIGTASTWAADLGKTITVDGKTYRMVKNNATLAAAANKVLARTAGTAGTWTVAPVTAVSALVAGVVPTGQKGSTGTTSLIAGDYFYLQVAGECTPLIHTTGTAVGAVLTTCSTAGTAEGCRVDNIANNVADLIGAFAKVLVESSGADAATQARLIGLI